MFVQTILAGLKLRPRALHDEYIGHDCHFASDDRMVLKIMNGRWNLLIDEEFDQRREAFTGHNLHFAGDNKMILKMMNGL
jgi:hypothetical protein